MKFIIVTLTAIFTLGISGVCYADSCASAERELTFGRMAFQDAQNKEGYLKAARQYEEAVDKAPSCAAAYFNLGLAYEKAEEYQKAHEALKQYLSLSPAAEDAKQVQNKIYELEYHASSKQDAQELFRSIPGSWKAICHYPDGTVRSLKYRFSIVGGDRIYYKFYHPGLGQDVVNSSYKQGVKYDFSANRFVSSEGFEDISWIYVRSKNKMETVGANGTPPASRCTFTR